MEKTEVSWFRHFQCNVVSKTAGLGLFEFSNVKIMTNYKSFILTPNPLDWATMHWLYISKDFFLETVSWLDENETLHQNFFKLCVYFIARVTDSGLIWFTLVITLFELLGVASHKLENFSYFWKLRDFSCLGGRHGTASSFHLEIFDASLTKFPLCHYIL